MGGRETGKDSVSAARLVPPLGPATGAGEDEEKGTEEDPCQKRPAAYENRFGPHLAQTQA